MSVGFAFIKLSHCIKLVILLKNSISNSNTVSQIYFLFDKLQNDYFTSNMSPKINEYDRPTMDSNIKVHTNNTRNDFLLYPNSYISNSAYQNLESQEEHEQQKDCHTSVYYIGLALIKNISPQSNH